MNIKEISKEIHQVNVDKGFWDEGKNRNKGEMIALIHSELSEALEADRDNKRAKAGKFMIDIGTYFEEKGERFDNFFKQCFEEDVKNSLEDELADVAIRLFDFAYGFDIDLEWHIYNKLCYNKLRPHKHGKKY